MPFKQQGWFGKKGQTVNLWFCAISGRNIEIVGITFSAVNENRKNLSGAVSKILPKKKVI